jgi:MGT family glycosyltransferase
MHFGILSSPVPGHLNPLCAIGRELISHGHGVTLFSIVDARDFVEKSKVNFQAIGLQEFGAGAFLREWEPIGGSSGFKGTMATLRLHTRLAAMMCREVPPLAKTLGIKAWIIDQIQYQGRAIAMVTGLPFVTVACALALHRGRRPQFPTPAVSWDGSSTSFFRVLRNRVAWYFFDLFSAPILGQGNRLLREHGMPGIRSVEESFSPLLQIIPLPRSLDWKFDFSRPEIVSYVGSLVVPSANEKPWRPPPGDQRQLVYVSLGTIQNRCTHYYIRIAEALAGLGAHAVFGLGDWLGNRGLPMLAGSPTVMRFAPQCAVLEHAALCITHGGCNTTAEALSFGVPLLVMPITTDQFGVAARVVASGAGLALSRNATTEAVREAVAFMLCTDRFRVRAEQLKKEIEEAGGVRAAASLVESVLVEKAIA